MFLFVALVGAVWAQCTPGQRCMGANPCYNFSCRMQQIPVCVQGQPKGENTSCATGFRIPCNFGRCAAGKCVVRDTPCTPSAQMCTSACNANGECRPCATAARNQTLEAPATTTSQAPPTALEAAPASQAPLTPPTPPVLGLQQSATTLRSGTTQELSLSATKSVQLNDGGTSTRGKQRDNNLPGWLPFLAIPAVAVLALVIGGVLYVMRKRALSAPAPNSSEPDDFAPSAPRWGTEVSIGEYTAPPRTVAQSHYDSPDSVLAR